MVKLFVDLDGTLTDFMKQLSDLLDKPLDRDWDFGNDPRIWKKVDEAGTDFWKTMPWMPDGKDLWDGIKEYKPTILSSPTRHSSSKEGKKLWLQDNLPKIPYIIDSKKEDYAKKDYILIDDREKNITKWEKAGGTGILHKNAKDTLKKLKDIMDEKDKDASLHKDLFFPKPLRMQPDYSGHVISTPKDGGEYHVLRIPKDVLPPNEGVKLNIGGVDLIVVSVKTPEDIAKGRGGLVAKSMIENGIGWDVLCLPPEHKYIMRNASMTAFKRLKELIGSLIEMGKLKEAAQLGTVSERWDAFLKNPNAMPGTDPKDSKKKLLWESGDKKIQIVKDVLENIVRRRTGTDIPREKLIDAEDILKSLRKMSVTQYLDPAEIDSEKKRLMDKAFNIKGDIAELIGLLFKPAKDKIERAEIENKINSIAKPYLLQARKDPFLSDFGGRSQIFNEMSRRANELDLSGLSDEHVRIVNACLEKISSIAKEAELNDYFSLLIDYMLKQQRNAQDIANRIMKGMDLWPDPNPDNMKLKRKTAWKDALIKIAPTPEKLLKVLMAFKLNSNSLDKLILPVAELASMVKLPVTEFIKQIDGNASAPNV